MIPSRPCETQSLTQLIPVSAVFCVQVTSSMSFCFAQRLAHFSSATWNGSAWKKTSPTLYFAVDLAGVADAEFAPRSDAAITPTARIPATPAQIPRFAFIVPPPIVDDPNDLPRAVRSADLPAHPLT